MDLQTELESTLEDKGGLNRSLSITIPVETVDEQINNRLQSLTKSAKINGFRPGKIPLKVIRNRFLSQVEAEVAGELIQNNFYRVVMDKELKPAGNPEIDGGVTNEMPHKAKISLTMREFKYRNGLSSENLRSEIQQHLSGKYPGVFISVEKDAKGPAVGYPVNIEISGRDYQKLIITAQE
ncbi:MAG: trigger factor, partial [Gammaproteobacteria bacterium]